jgi:hypothetical protein
MGLVTPMGKEPTVMIIPHHVDPVYPQIDHRAGLRYLLDYAISHPHSSAWIPAITLILSRRGGDQ